MFAPEQDPNGDPSNPKEVSRYQYRIGNYGDTPRRCQSPTPPPSPAGKTGSLGVLSQRSSRRRRGSATRALVNSLPVGTDQHLGGNADQTADHRTLGVAEAWEARDQTGVPVHLLQPSAQSTISLARWGSPFAPKDRIILGKWIERGLNSEFQTRFTVLNEYTVRCECTPSYPPHNYFEDRPSIRFWRRNLQQKAEISVRRRHDGLLLIMTEIFTLLYDPVKSRGAFDQGALRIYLNQKGTIAKIGNEFSRTDWTLSTEKTANPFSFAYGISDLDLGNCGGTCRTLDGADGWEYDTRSQCEYKFGSFVGLGNGIISRRGWTAIDDSESPVFDSQGWVCERTRDPRSVDIYVFMYGENYIQALQSFTSIAGRVPVLPRYALGNWWSRWWAYSQEEIVRWIDEWQTRRKVPLSVCVLDMDWHLPGWTGYTWNPEFFPDPAQALRDLKKLGVRVALNVHPADGVHSHEAMYATMASALGIDASSGTPLHFNVASPSYMKSYFEILHHPHERIGVDFWWIDWQQGSASGVPGLDPLFLLNHLHFLDAARQFDRIEQRPLILSRYGGLGCHRYAVGFSGDTHSTWRSLGVQPVVTSTAANVGFFFWSHDIGGFMGGIQPDGELYLRWVQLGLYSPILRLHGHKSEFLRRWPWSFERTHAHIANAVLRYRHRLIPYIYSECVKASLKSSPLCRPMYFQYPRHNPLAYAACNTQYFFGDELLIAPFLEPAIPSVGCARRVLWLPPGCWRRLPSGESYLGDRWICVYGGNDDVPVFAAAGRVIPVASSKGCRSGTMNDFSKVADDHLYDSEAGLEHPEILDITIVAGAEHSYQLIEDDGSGGDDPLRRTRVTYISTDFNYEADPTASSRRMSRESLEVRIWSNAITSDQDETTTGATWPEARQFTIHLVGVSDFEAKRNREDGFLASVIIEDETHAEEIDSSCRFSYEASRETWTCSLPRLDLDCKIRIAIRGAGLISSRDRRLEKLQEILQCFRLDCWSKMCLARELPSFLEGTKSVQDILAEDTSLKEYVYAGKITAEQIRALYEIAHECGVEWLKVGYHPLWPQPPPIVAWNPRGSLAFMAPTPTTLETRRERHLLERREIHHMNEALAEAILQEQRALSQLGELGRLNRPPPVSSAESEGYSDSLPPRIPSRRSNLGLTTANVPSILPCRQLASSTSFSSQVGTPPASPRSVIDATSRSSMLTNSPMVSGSSDYDRKSLTPTTFIRDPALAGFRIVREQELVFPAVPEDEWHVEYHYGPDLVVRICSDHPSPKLILATNNEPQ
ncbi:hypothetical protein CCYA_CCYA06G1748 [Cyanidiococcus yangmingshanensis]|nr:hypothetical protein CCYA_CCYA06G1748 [Cyanidiococcus yangmingshanensis]